MFSKKIVSSNKKSNINNYRFSVNDPVLCTKNDIKNAIILSRYFVGDVAYYKIGNNLTTKICKENELINR